MAKMNHADIVFLEQEFRGEWWLPSNPDHKVSGILRGRVSNGFRLELMGSLNPNPWSASLWDNSPESIQYDTPKIIWGRTFSGFFTLFKNFRTSTNSSSMGVHTTVYGSDLVTRSLSVSLESFEELRFKKVCCKFSVLCDWIDAKVFSETFFEGHKKEREKFDIRFSFPKEAVIYENSHYSIKLSFDFSGPASRLGQKEVQVEWEPQFVIESKGEELPWSSKDDLNYLSITYSLNQFLAVATFGSCYPFDIVGYSCQFEKTVGDNPEKKYKIPITLYQEWCCDSSKYDCCRILFPWTDIEKNPQSFFEKWFSMFLQISGPVELFTDSLSKRNSYSPERFFNLVCALEGLHRFKNPKARVATEEHGHKLQAILESAPTEYSQWLSEALELSHQPSLRKRLKDLVRPFREIFDWLIGNEGNSKKRQKWRHIVVEAIANSRNTLGHCLSEVGNDPGSRYYHFTQIAELLLAMFLMKEIGIDDKQIAKRIQKNPLTSQCRNRLAKFLKEEL
ncbi:MAG: hypothetical protein K8S55_14610 [Phycisphaerae bacterium]|nr:hypothetical protein [Phycisphaerae bacterium]